MTPDDTQTYSMIIPCDIDFHVKCRERIERIDQRVKYMFENAPETYRAIKVIIYAG